jgi:hypothetical protein
VSGEGDTLSPANGANAGDTVPADPGATGAHIPGPTAGAATPPAGATADDPVPADPEATGAHNPGPAQGQRFLRYETVRQRARPAERALDGHVPVPFAFPPSRDPAVDYCSAVNVRFGILKPEVTE